jgi:hypothetical protein
MIVVFTREDSLKSIGELTFDESFQFDEEYQKHQRRLLRKEKGKKDTVDRIQNIEAPVSTGKLPKQEELVRTRTTDKKPKETENAATQEAENAATNSFKPNGSRHHLSTNGYGDMNQRSPAKVTKKSKPQPTKLDAFDGSEVSGGSVSLSDLYSCWKSQTSASMLSGSCNAASRTTTPSPPTGSHAEGRSKHTFVRTDSSTTEEDACYIFGAESSSRSKADHEREQEEFILSLVLQRSLEDHSSSSSISGFSGSTQNSDLHSLDTGQHAIRNPAFRQRQRPPQRSGSRLGSAGCHLAMVSSDQNGARIPPTTTRPTSILQAMDNESDDEEDIPFAAPSHAQRQSTFVWKRDVRSNKWYKKPVFASAPSTNSEEDSMLEAAMQQSARDALANSFIELQLAAVSPLKPSKCRHW